MPLAMLLMLVVKLNKFYFTRPIATFTVFRRIVEGYARKMTVLSVFFYIILIVELQVLYKYYGKGNFVQYGRPRPVEEGR